MAVREAIVLAGGLGTRLASVLPGAQKVTAQVAGAPFALRLAEWLGSFDVRRVVFAAGHRAQDVQALSAMAAAEGPELITVVEPEPLGTGGAARFAADRTSAEPVLVLNGDSFAEIDLNSLYRFHAQHEARVTLALAPVPDPGRYGLVTSGADGVVTAFDEKLAETSDEGWINAGLYLFRREALMAIESGRAVSLEREVFPSLIGRGLFALPFEARFIDIGTPEALSAAQTFFGDARA